ncbi:hypothetical protein FRB96_003286 [Tulasnella sp. 330]|nr:hypothetical protein FRB96_003286 [Tulasnella sp. 330]
MTRYIHAPTYEPAMASSAFFLGEISRQKLQKVAESSDTLRRCVLIHNIMRSTASIQAPPTPPPSPTNTFDQHHLYYQEHHSTQQDYYDDEEEEAAYQEAVRGGAGGVSAADHSTEYMTGLTSTSSRSGEQDWLDSILDDLDEEDVHVSVVDAEDDDDEQMEDASPTTPEWHPPLFPAPQCNFMPTSPPSSPPLGPTSPRFIPIPDSTSVDDCLCTDQLDLEDDSPPPSPPGLDADTIDSEDDSDDEYHYGMMYDSTEDYSEAETPSASTEFPQATAAIPTVTDYLSYDHPYNQHLPNTRLRPVLCQFRESNHSPPY